MINIRRAADRGQTNMSWLQSYHSFSFGEYYDRRHMGFRSLRVLNDDVIAAGMGFGTHPHHDMEIITIVLDGALQHKDSLGTGSVIRPGEVQRMSAGTGILHSEFNDSVSAPAHLLQVWLLPEKKGLEPGYEQKAFPEAERRGRLRLVAARDGRAGALTIHQDAELYVTKLESGESATHRLRPGRAAWLQVGTGAVTLNGQRLETGDGAAVEKENTLEIAGVESADVLFFDLG